MANTVQLVDPYWWRLQPAADLFTARALFLPSVDYCTQCKQSRGRNRARADLESQMSKVSDNDMISHCGKIGSEKSTYQPLQWRHCSSSWGMQVCVVLPISNFSCLHSCLSEFVNNFDLFYTFWFVLHQHALQTFPDYFLSSPPKLVFSSCYLCLLNSSSHWQCSSVLLVLINVWPRKLINSVSLFAGESFFRVQVVVKLMARKEPNWLRERQRGILRYFV